MKQDNQTQGVTKKKKKRRKRKNPNNTVTHYYDEMSASNMEWMKYLSYEDLINLNKTTTHPYEIEPKINLRKIARRREKLLNETGKRRTTSTATPYGAKRRRSTKKWTTLSTKRMIQYNETESSNPYTDDYVSQVESHCVDIENAHKDKSYSEDNESDTYDSKSNKKSTHESNAKFTKENKSRDPHRTQESTSEYQSSWNKRCSEDQESHKTDRHVSAGYHKHKSSYGRDPLQSQPEEPWSGDRKKEKTGKGKKRKQRAVDSDRTNEGVSSYSTNSRSSKSNRSLPPKNKKTFNNRKKATRRVQKMTHRTISIQEAKERRLMRKGKLTTTSRTTQKYIPAAIAQRRKELQKALSMSSHEFNQDELIAPPNISTKYQIQQGGMKDIQDIIGTLNNTNNEKLFYNIMQDLEETGTVKKNLRKEVEHLRYKTHQLTSLQLTSTIQTTPPKFTTTQVKTIKTDNTPIKTKRTRASTTFPLYFDALAELDKTVVDTRQTKRLLRSTTTKKKKSIHELMGITRKPLSSEEKLNTQERKEFLHDAYFDYGPNGPVQQDIIVSTSPKREKTNRVTLVRLITTQVNEIEEIENKRKELDLKLMLGSDADYYDEMKRIMDEKTIGQHTKERCMEDMKVRKYAQFLTTKVTTPSTVSTLDQSVITKTVSKQHTGSTERTKHNAYHDDISGDNTTGEQTEYFFPDKNPLFDIRIPEGDLTTRKSLEDMEENIQKYNRELLGEEYQHDYPKAKRRASICNDKSTMEKKESYRRILQHYLRNDKEGPDSISRYIRENFNSTINTNIHANRAATLVHPTLATDISQTQCITTKQIKSISITKSIETYSDEKLKGCTPAYGWDCEDALRRDIFKHAGAGYEEVVLASKSNDQEQDKYMKEMVEADKQRPNTKSIKKTQITVKTKITNLKTLSSMKDVEEMKNNIYKHSEKTSEEYTKDRRTKATTQDVSSHTKSITTKHIKSMNTAESKETWSDEKHKEYTPPYRWDGIDALKKDIFKHAGEGYEEVTFASKLDDHEIDQYMKEMEETDKQHSTTERIKPNKKTINTKRTTDLTTLSSKEVEEMMKNKDQHFEKILGEFMKDKTKATRLVSSRGKSTRSFSPTSPRDKDSEWKTMKNFCPVFINQTTFESECQKFIRIINKRGDSKLQRLSFEMKTKNNPTIGKIISVNLLTANNFADIIKRTMKKPSDVATSIIYTPIAPKIIDGDAMKKYENLSGFFVSKCGYFIDDKYPFLGVIPDGLIGEGGIVKFVNTSTYPNVDLKVLLLRDKRLRDNFIVGKDISLAPQGSLMYEIQGALHIAKKHFCDLFVHNGNGNLLLKIKRDKDFWKSNMRKPLIEFYRQHMLPAVVKRILHRRYKVHDEFLLNSEEDLLSVIRGLKADTTQQTLPTRTTEMTALMEKHNQRENTLDIQKIQEEWDFFEKKTMRISFQATTVASSTKLRKRDDQRNKIRKSETLRRKNKNREKFNTKESYHGDRSGDKKRRNLFKEENENQKENSRSSRSRSSNSGNRRRKTNPSKERQKQSKRNRIGSRRDPFYEPLKKCKEETKDSLISSYENERNYKSNSESDKDGDIYKEEESFSKEPQTNEIKEKETYDHKDGKTDRSYHKNPKRQKVSKSSESSRDSTKESRRRHTKRNFFLKKQTRKSRTSLERSRRFKRKIKRIKRDLQKVTEILIKGTRSPRKGTMILPPKALKVKRDVFYDYHHDRNTNSSDDKLTIENLSSYKDTEYEPDSYDPNKSEFVELPEVVAKKQAQPDLLVDFYKKGLISKDEFLEIVKNKTREGKPWRLLQSVESSQTFETENYSDLVKARDGIPLSGMSKSMEEDSKDYDKDDICKKYLRNIGYGRPVDDTLFNKSIIFTADDMKRMKQEKIETKLKRAKAKMKQLGKTYKKRPRTTPTTTTEEAMKARKIQMKIERKLKQNKTLRVADLSLGDEEIEDMTMRTRGWKSTPIPYDIYNESYRAERRHNYKRHYRMYWENLNRLKRLYPSAETGENPDKKLSDRFYRGLKMEGVKEKTAEFPSDLNCMHSYSTEFREERAKRHKILKHIHAKENTDEIVERLARKIAEKKLAQNENISTEKLAKKLEELKKLVQRKNEKDEKRGRRSIKDASSVIQSPSDEDEQDNVTAEFKQESVETELKKLKMGEEEEERPTGTPKFLLTTDKKKLDWSQEKRRRRKLLKQKPKYAHKDSGSLEFILLQKELKKNGEDFNYLSVSITNETITTPVEMENTYGRKIEDEKALEKILREKSEEDRLLQNKDQMTGNNPYHYNTSTPLQTTTITTEKEQGDLTKKETRKRGRPRKKINASFTTVKKTKRLNTATAISLNVRRKRSLNESGNERRAKDKRKQEIKMRHRSVKRKERKKVSKHFQGNVKEPPSKINLSIKKHKKREYSKSDEKSVTSSQYNSNSMSNSQESHPSSHSKIKENGKLKASDQIEKVFVQNKSREKKITKESSGISESTQETSSESKSVHDKKKKNNERERKTSKNLARKKLKTDETGLQEISLSSTNESKKKKYAAQLKVARKDRKSSTEASRERIDKYGRTRTHEIDHSSSQTQSRNKFEEAKVLKYNTRKKKLRASRKKSFKLLDNKEESSSSSREREKGKRTKNIASETAATKEREKIQNEYQRTKKRKIIVSDDTSSQTRSETFVSESSKKSSPEDKIFARKHSLVRSREKKKKEQREGNTSKSVAESIDHKSKKLRSKVEKSSVSSSESRQSTRRGTDRKVQKELNDSRSGTTTKKLSKQEYKALQRKLRRKRKKLFRKKMKKTNKTIKTNSTTRKQTTAGAKVTKIIAYKTKATIRPTYRLDGPDSDVPYTPATIVVRYTKHAKQYKKLPTRDVESIFDHKVDNYKEFLQKYNLKHGCTPLGKKAIKKMENIQIQEGNAKQMDTSELCSDSSDSDFINADYSKERKQKPWEDSEQKTSKKMIRYVEDKRMMKTKPWNPKNKEEETSEEEETDTTPKEVKLKSNRKVVEAENTIKLRKLKEKSERVTGKKVNNLKFKKEYTERKRSKESKMQDQTIRKTHESNTQEERRSPSSSDDKMTASDSYSLGGDKPGPILHKKGSTGSYSGDYSAELSESSLRPDESASQIRREQWKLGRAKTDLHLKSLSKKTDCTPHVHKTSHRLKHNRGSLMKVPRKTDASAQKKSNNGDEVGIKKLSDHKEEKVLKREKRTPGATTQANVINMNPLLLMTSLSETKKKKKTTKFKRGNKPWQSKEIASDSNITMNPMFIKLRKKLERIQNNPNRYNVYRVKNYTSVMQEKGLWHLWAKPGEVIPSTTLGFHHELHLDFTVYQVTDKEVYDLIAAKLIRDHAVPNKRKSQFRHSRQYYEFLMSTTPDPLRVGFSSEMRRYWEEKENLDLYRYRGMRDMRDRPATEYYQKKRMAKGKRWRMMIAAAARRTSTTEGKRRGHIRG